MNKIEVIVVDGMSEDETLTIIEKYYMSHLE